jgi:hypothetical protein
VAASVREPLEVEPENVAAVKDSIRDWIAPSDLQRVLGATPTE